MPDLSIIIVNYNTREPLRRCLKSIQTHKAALNVETIVVDNASKDGSADMVRQVMPEAILVEPGCNTWFTGGNNIGIQKATGDYVLILNPDTVFQKDTMQTMIAYLKAHPKVGSITCQMRFPDGGLQNTGSRIPAYVDLLLGYTFLGVVLRSWRDNRRKHMWFTDWQRDTTRPVEVIPDSNMMSPLALIRRLKGFDETLKLYFTEDDICRRILDAGYEIHFVAEALLIHEEHASTSQVQRLASQVYFQDLLKFSRKYYGVISTLILQGLIWPTRQAMDIKQRLRGERQSL
ncbi:MAG: glycosyltransferase family 2 protein [Anaerolineae bacterium]|nr:glycosyltransferase family 2 protein [Anaerolineae bacterium]